VVAVIGQVDHGRTTLVSAMSKVASESGHGTFIAVEELEKTTETGIARVATAAMGSASRRYTLVDFPGHADTVKALITGSVIPSAAIVVISAADGPMPQTRRQLLLARRIGVQRIVVALTKIDAVDDRELLLLESSEIREMLTVFGFPRDTPIVAVSALNVLQAKPKAADAIARLFAALDNRMAVPLNRAESQTTAQGDFDAEIYLLMSEEGGRSTPIFNGYRPAVSVAGIVHPATVTLFQAESLSPGDSASVSLHFDEPLRLADGTHFDILEDSHIRGAGVIFRADDGSRVQ
jgi:translation elongation factor EF-Tu-like GTPase